MPTPATTVRIDPETKAGAQKVFEEMGISLSQAINLFLKAVASQGEIPFDLRLAGRKGE